MIYSMLLALVSVSMVLILGNQLHLTASLFTTINSVICKELVFNTWILHTLFFYILILWLFTQPLRLILGR